MAKAELDGEGRRPGDEAERRKKWPPPGGYYLTHHSVESHPKTVEIYKSNDLYATWHRLHQLASERRAALRDDWVNLSPSDVHAVTMAKDWRVAAHRLQRVCDLQGWVFEWYDEGETAVPEDGSQEVSERSSYVDERSSYVPPKRSRYVKKYRVPEWLPRRCIKVQIRNFAIRQGGLGPDGRSASTRRTKVERSGNVLLKNTNTDPTYSVPEKTEQNTPDLVVAAAPQTTLPGIDLAPVKIARPEVSAAEIVEAYKRLCVPMGACDVLELTESRRKKLQVRIREHPDFEWWDGLFQTIIGMPFCFGHNSTGWRIDLDWLIANDKNIVRILEGRYRQRDNRQKRQAAW